MLEFGIGFPPRAQILRSDGETLYTLNWLPIGGFVKLEGEDGDDDADPHSFANAGCRSRSAILLAGVTMNLLLSFAIFSGDRDGGASPAVGACDRARSSRGRPRPRPASWPATRSSRSTERTRPSTYGPDPLDDLRALAGETVTLGILHADGTSSDVDGHAARAQPDRRSRARSGSSARQVVDHGDRPAHAGGGRRRSASSGPWTRSA